MATEPVRLEARHAVFAIDRPAPGIVRLTIIGRDTGEFGAAPFRELEKDLTGSVKPEIFVDARAVAGASVDVSAEWARWLIQHKARYTRLSFLTGTRFMHLTASFVQRFTQLGERMRVYTDAGAFDAALRAASAPAARPS
ncbi:MAG TPA: hypothetical protein VJU61_22390 [Polyangiaceae bacterium]|nr:hypothetical protein [Polyangiaceae bacterium]